MEQFQCKPQCLEIRLLSSLDYKIPLFWKLEICEYLWINYLSSICELIFMNCDFSVWLELVVDNDCFKKNNMK